MLFRVAAKPQPRSPGQRSSLRFAPAGRDRDRAGRPDERCLDGLDLVAVMVDGVHFGQHTYVVALGIGIDGVKHPLAVDEDSTENATLVTDLITGLRERGLDVTRPILAVLDGARALPRAVKDVFGQPLIQRCQQYKIRNVTGKLPDRLKQVTERWMRQMRMLSMPSFT